MSEEDDILNKMDALLKRHQPASATPQEIPMLSEVVVQPDIPESVPAIDVPILTSVVEAGTLHSTPAKTKQVAKEENFLPSDGIENGAKDHTPLSEAAMAQLLHTVDQHISQMLIKNLAPQLISSLDRSVSAMMVQFNSHIEELVRDAITSELQKYLDNFVIDLTEATSKAAPDTSGTSGKDDSV